MPQLDQSTFALQSVFMTFFFLFFYFIFKKKILPKISQSLKLREFLINDLSLRFEYKKILYFMYYFFNQYSHLLMIYWYFYCLNNFFYLFKNKFFKSLYNFEKKNFQNAHHYYLIKSLNYNKIKNFLIIKN